MRTVALDVDRTNAAFDVLGHHYRRFVLSDLDDRRPPEALDDVAARATEWAQDAAAGGTAAFDRESVMSDLHHRHLPKIEEAGLLTYRASEHRIVDWADLDLPEGWLSQPSIEPVMVSMSAL